MGLFILINNFPRENHISLHCQLFEWLYLLFMCGMFGFGLLRADWISDTDFILMEIKLGMYN